VHGLAGLANAQQNCWPMILFGGASETYRGGMGAFQEERSDRPSLGGDRHHDRRRHRVDGSAEVTSLSGRHTTVREDFPGMPSLPWSAARRKPTLVGLKENQRIRLFRPSARP
jgi:hypothetical protein